MSTLPTRRRLATLALVLLLALIAALVVRRNLDRSEGPSSDAAVPSDVPLNAAPSLLPGPISGRGGPKWRAAEPPTVATVPPPTVAPSLAESSPGLVVRGRVRTSEGVGVVGVSVELRAWSGSKTRPTWSNREVKTGLGGVYEFSIEPPVASAGFVVVVSAEGFLEVWRAVDPKDYDGAQSIDLEIETARSIACRVLDADARPIPGASAMLWYGSDSTWPTSADREGRIRTPARAPHRAFELIVEAPGYPRREVPVAASTLDRTDIGDVVFRKGGVVAGVVVDGRGEPVEDLNLVILNLGPSGKASDVRAKTDARGRFEFSDLGLGIVSIFADAPNLGGPPGARRAYRGGIGGVEVGRRDVRIVCGTECLLILRFVDAVTGEPLDVHEAEYGARYEGTPVPEQLGAGGSGSDPFRTARLTVASGHRYDVAVRSPGFELGRADGIDVRDLEEIAVDVRLTRSK